MNNTYVYMKCWWRRRNVRAPHVDLTKPLDNDERQHAQRLSDQVDGIGVDGLSSTHTFILHLVSCNNGGETVMLHQLAPPSPIDAGSAGSNVESVVEDDGGGDEGSARETAAGGNSAGCEEDSAWIIGTAAPVRSRLVIFPHICPHAGLPTGDTPKLFLRGELLVRRF